ncbi:MAG: heparinase II/III family protein [Hyphomicrobiales bacterium]|nr:heparinase II/III family protein [Hyphomicrobiales bacterium]
MIPQDLRTSDPSFASELYDGYFGLAGTVALTGSVSPFTVQPPSLPWQRELYGMGWLHNMEAAGDQIAQEKARALILDWIEHSGDAPPIAWELDVVARRVSSVLSHAGFLLRGTQSNYYHSIMRMLTTELHYLTANYGEAYHTAPRLFALTTILLSGLCVKEHQSLLNSYQGVFLAELERQVFQDGGHISRNPSTLVELLLELLPLKQCFLARKMETPEQLNRAIGRMMGMIRFMRLGDGSLGRFNGMGATRSDLLAAVLAHADDGVIPQGYAKESGYCRLVRDQTIVIADVGTPPPDFASANAHAGYLSFEMTTGIEPLIVNCGAPRDELTDWTYAARATAAHSTLTINDESSSKLIKRKTGMGGEVHLLSGPSNVTTELARDRNELLVKATHDGFEEKYGYVHQRRLRLTGDGMSVEGVDQLTLAPHNRHNPKDGDTFTIRFHLHPRVSPSLHVEENSVGLTTPDAQLWKLRAAGAKIGIEESTFLADPIIQKRSMQVVMRGECGTGKQVVWSIRRIQTNVRDPSRSGYRGPRIVEDES